MSNETIFYICGGILAASAVIVSFLGLKLKGFPGKALPLVVLWFVIFVGGATAFATRYSGEEHEKKAAEYAKFFEEAEAKEGEEGSAQVEEPAGKSESEGGKEAGGGASTTLQLEADKTALAFNTTKLTAKAGKVMIDFKNPSVIPHDVVIEQNGKELAAVEQITESEASTTANLKPGTYTFFCSLPGHRQAGMEGTLTVK
ncbi:MAG: plastocyanin/azurin family copper-binding protein [Solirubrobacterales bacterium]